MLTNPRDVLAALIAWPEDLSLFDNDARDIAGRLAEQKRLRALLLAAAGRHYTKTECCEECRAELTADHLGATCPHTSDCVLGAIEREAQRLVDQSPARGDAAETAGGRRAAS